MSIHKQRAVRIGIALNSSSEGDNAIIDEQYTTSNRVFNEISQSLTQHGAKVIKIEGDGQFYQRLSELADEVDLIFNLAEDVYQVAVPMAIAQSHIERKKPYPVCTGSQVEGHVLALNKSLTRQVLGSKIPQPKWRRLNPNEYPAPGSIDFPVLVKPTGEGHSLGIADANVVSSMAELGRSLEELWGRFGKAMLVESYLDGIEYSMGVIGNVVSPAVAWDLSELPGKPLVRGEDLKQQDLTIPHATLVSDPSLAAAIATYVVTVHRELGLNDYSRSDFRAKGNEPVPYYIETNSMPGLVKNDSVLPWSVSKTGVEYADLIGSIAAQALKRLPKDHYEQLDTKGFEDAYLRLCNLTSHTISVQGREYYLLVPKD